MIEWVRNPDGSPGYSWNPITGCLNGCPYCYARRLANTRLRNVYLNNKELASCPSPTRAHVNDPFYPRFWPEKLWLHRGDYDKAYPSRNAYQSAREKAKGIFVCDMGDLFGKGVPDDWTRQVLAVVECHPQHRFYLLTKQPQNLAAFSPFPSNAWVGVSATNQAMFDEGLAHLLKIKATVRFMSVEPMLEPVRKPSRWLCPDFIIIGAQTNPTKLPELNWVMNLEADYEDEGVALFEKDSLAPLFPVARALRREWPK